MNIESLKLGDLAIVSSGAGAPQEADAFTEKGHPFIRAGSLPKLLDGIQEEDLEKIEPRVAEEYGLELFPSGTVLFAKSGMSATKGYVYKLKNPAYIVSHLAALIPREPEDGAFLVRALERFSPTSLIRDASYPSIRLGDIESMRIDAPNSLHDRRRLATILDEADGLRRKRRDALKRLEQVYFATFVDIFGDPTTNPKKWPIDAHLGDVADIVSGITKGRKLNGSPTRLVPYLAVINVQDRSLNLEAVKNIEATEAEVARYRLQKNDLLLTEGGDPDKLGRGALWQDQIPDCIHQNHIFRVRLTRNVVDPVFLNWLVGGPRGKAYFLRSAKQTTGIASINMTQLREFPLMLPPIDLQRTFAGRVAAIDKLKAQQFTYLAKLNVLFESLQSRGFNGEL